MPDNLSRENHRPPASLVVSSICLLLVLAAAGFLLVHGCLGIAAPFGPGPAGERLADYAIGARALARDGLGTLLAAQSSALTVMGAIAYQLLGEQPLAARVPGILLTVLSALALGRLAWKGWGPWAAVSAVAVFALLPRAALAAVPDGEMASLFGALMALGSYIAFREEDRPVSAATAIAWLAVGGLFGWGALAVGAFLAVHGLAAGWRQGRMIAAERPSATLARASGPLAAVMAKRASEKLSRFATVVGLAVLIEAAVMFVWRLAMRGTVVPESVPSLAALFPWSARLAVAVALGVVVLRLVAGRSQPRDAILLALGAATAATLFISDIRWGLTAGAALIAISLVDVTATLARMLDGRWASGLSWGGKLVALGVFLTFAASFVPTWERNLIAVRESGALALDAVMAPPAVPLEETRIVAALAAGRTGPADVVLVRAGFPLTAHFRYALDRPMETVADLWEVSKRHGTVRNALVVFKDPVAEPERAMMGAWLKAHPANRVAMPSGGAGLWLIDLRASEPGIISAACSGQAAARAHLHRFLLYPDGDRRCRLEREPWRELELDLRYGISPVPERRPQVTLEQATDRGRLVGYHNLYTLAGVPGEKSGARTRLLEGAVVPAVWLDPAPFGWIAGVRWLPSTRALSILWDCPGRPPPVPDFGMRLVVQPLERQWRPHVIDLPGSLACEDATAGELREESIVVKFPYRGKFDLSMEVTRPSRKARRATGQTIPLVEVEHSR